MTSNGVPKGICLPCLRSDWLRASDSGEFIFYCAFACYSFAEVLDTTAFTVAFPKLNLICTGLRCLTVAMLFLRLLLLKETGAQWIFTIAGLGLAGYIFMLKHFDYSFWILLFVFTGRNVDLKKLAKIALIVVSITTFISILSSYAGLIPQLGLRVSGDRSARSAIGFKHPNRLAERITEICIAYWYLWGLERRFNTVALNSIAFLFVYFVTDSRGSCVLLLALTTAALIFPYIKKTPRFSVACCLMLVAGTVFVSFYLMVSYSASSELLKTLNASMSGRLSLANASYEYAGLTLFGSDFSNAPVVAAHYLDGADVHFLVDNAYVHVLLEDGVVPTALFLTAIAFVYIRYIHVRQFPAALLGLTILLAFGFFENFPICLEFNYFILIICDLVFRNKAGSICIPGPAAIGVAAREGSA